MNRARLTLLSVGCAALLATKPAAVSAQEVGVSRDPASSCVMSIPDSALWRVTVYLQAEVRDSTDRPLLPGLDLLTQEVADSVRSSLGAAVDQLPNGEPTVTWRGTDASLLVEAYRDGRITSRLQTPEAPVDTDSYAESFRADDSASVQLLARALVSVSGNGDYFMIWPDGFERDSVAFRLVMHRPRVDSHGSVTPFEARQAFPLFRAGVPTEEPVVTKRRPHVNYPERLQERRVIGNLLMQFIVDTTGRAEMETVKDLWPSSKPRLTGELGGYYDSFRRAIVHALANATFEPARIGGCKVRQLVQMPFGFRM